ncbi:hypothetical protein [Paraburkholderia sp. RL17-347-BIC-D]|uniref:hypothetical protein n=1 Tax=Paraburkholderia sp. RL17-347-BIC-D TaxID=3031632 RepID=UPI0038B766B5
MNVTTVKIVGIIDIPKGAEDSKRENVGFVRICGEVVFHLDVLKVTLRNGDASDAPFNAKAKKQMSPNLKDLW